MAQPAKKAVEAAREHALRAAANHQVPYVVYSDGRGNLQVKRKDRAPPDTNFIFDTDHPEEVNDAS